MEQLILALVLLGLSTGVCIGAILSYLLTKHETSEDVHKSMVSQRELLRSLRADFHRFVENQEREFTTIIDTLRASPRSVSSNEEPSVS